MSSNFPLSTRPLNVLGLPGLLHGCDYNPDQWQHAPEVIDEDFRLFPEAGIGVLSVNICGPTLHAHGRRLTSQYCPTSSRRILPRKNRRRPARTTSNLPFHVARFFKPQSP